MERWEPFGFLVAVLIGYLGGTITGKTKTAIAVSVVLSAILMAYNPLLYRAHGRGLDETLSCLHWRLGILWCPRPMTFWDFVPWGTSAPASPGDGDQYAGQLLRAHRDAELAYARGIGYSQNGRPKDAIRAFDFAICE